MCMLACAFVVSMLLNQVISRRGRIIVVILFEKVKALNYFVTHANLHDKQTFWRCIFMFSYAD